MNKSYREIQSKHFMRESEFRERSFFGMIDFCMLSEYYLGRSYWGFDSLNCW